MTRAYERNRPGRYDTRYDTLIDAISRKGKKAFRDIQKIIAEYEDWIDRMPQSAKDRLKVYALSEEIEFVTQPFSGKVEDFNKLREANLGGAVESTKATFDMTIDTLKMGAVRNTEVMAQVMPESTETYDPDTGGLGVKAWEYF